MDYKYETLISRVIENVRGHHMTLKINKFQCGYEMNISRNWSHSFKVYILLLLILSSIGLTNFTLQIYNISYFIVLLAAFAFIFHKLTSILKSENLLVVKNVGYQIEVNYLFGKKRTFISWPSVESIFINEVISMQRVLFMLTIKTWLEEEKKHKLFPLFQMTSPRLRDIKDVYRLLKLL